MPTRPERREAAPRNHDGGLRAFSHRKNHPAPPILRARRPILPNAPIATSSPGAQ